MLNSEIHPSERLKRLRENLNMSQRELALEFNVSSAAIAQWELGSNPIPGLLVKLMDIYEQAPCEKRKDQDDFLNLFNDRVKEFKDLPNEISVIKAGIIRYMDDVSLFNSVQAKFK